MASPITWKDVVGFAPELNTVGSPAQNIILSIVNGAGLNVDNFGGEDASLTKDARILYAAHIATLQKRKGTGGLIASQSEGGASQSYAYPWLSLRLLHATSYGMLLAQMIQGTPARAGMLV